MPLRKRKDKKTTNGCHEGGICNDKFEFISGLRRTLPHAEENWTCLRSYEYFGNIRKKEETVVFGGILINHFGHTLVDCLSRMWWYANNRDTEYKIVFLMMTNHKKAFTEFFELAGITEDKYEIITERTQFKKVIVPEEAVYSLSSKAYPQWVDFFNLIKERIAQQCKPSALKRIYLTRTQMKEKEGVNEEYFEQFYSKREYEIIAPEQLPLKEQINIISNADSIVCTLGTLSHMALFAKPGVEMIILTRTTGHVVKPQTIINLIKDVDCVYIEAIKNILPTTHDHGMPLYVPTEYFIEYLDDNNIDYSTEEIDELGIIKANLYDYLLRYADHYSNPKRYKLIRGRNSFDFVYSLNKTLLNTELQKENYDITKALDKKVQQLETENKKLKSELNRIKNSRSYKITAPLRWLGKKIRKIKKLFKK